MQVRRLLCPLRVTLSCLLRELVQLVDPVLEGVQPVDAASPKGAAAEMAGRQPDLPGDGCHTGLVDQVGSGPRCGSHVVDRRLGRLLEAVDVDLPVAARNRVDPEHVGQVGEAAFELGDPLLVGSVRRGRSSSRRGCGPRRERRGCGDRNGDLPREVALVQVGEVLEVLDLLTLVGGRVVPDDLHDVQDAPLSSVDLVLENLVVGRGRGCGVEVEVDHDYSL